MDETFEPKDEGLNVVRRKRRVGAVTVTLCGDISRMNAGAVGYQAPVPEDEVTPKVTARTKPKKRRTSSGERKPTTRTRRAAGGRDSAAAAEEAEEGETVRQEPARSGPTETHGDAASSFVDAGAMSGGARSELVSSRRRR